MKGIIQDNDASDYIFIACETYPKTSYMYTRYDQK